MEERKSARPNEQPRKSEPETKDEPIEGGGVAQGDIRIPRHEDEDESEA
jgi:hypothetical protein